MIFAVPPPGCFTFPSDFSVIILHYLYDINSCKTLQNWGQMWTSTWLEEYCLDIFSKEAGAVMGVELTAFLCVGEL